MTAIAESGSRSAARAERRRRDAVGLLTVYLGLLIFIPSRLVIAPLGANGSPSTLVGIALAGWWFLVRLVPAFRSPRGTQPVRIAVATFTGCVLASYAWSALHALPAAHRAAADTGLITLASFCGPALVAADLVADLDGLRCVVRRLVALAAVAACLGILQFAVGFDITSIYQIPGLTAHGVVGLVTERSAFRRVAGPTNHPIELGVVLATVFPLALHVLHTQVRHRRRWLLATLAIASTIPMTLSRSAIIGLGVASIVAFAGWDGARRARALVIAPVFVVGLRMVIPGLVGTLNSLFTNASNDPSIQNRTDAYGLVGRFIEASPVLGRGFGTFVPQDFFFLDNQYLGSIVETGYVGLAALLGVFVVSWATARGARRRSTDPVVRDLGQALAAGVAVVAVTFATFDGLGFPTIDGVAFVVIGCAGCLWRIVTGTSASDAAPDPAPATTQAPHAVAPTALARQAVP